MSEIKLFESKKIRSALHEGEWFFAVADVVGVLTESVNSGDYWRKLKQREPQLVTNCHKLKMPAANGRMYKIDCANKEGLLRIIQSVPSPKAEPFKKWLANVGSKVLDEKANKRLAAHRKLKETQNRFLDNVKNRGVDEEGFVRVVKAGDDALFNESNMHDKYELEKEENIDDYMHEYLLRGKDFATAMTHFNVHQADLQGEEDITDEHKASNKQIRKTIQKSSKINPEDIPAQKNINKLKGKSEEEKKKLDE